MNEIAVRKLHEQGIYAVVGVEAPEAMGSGTIFWSRPHPEEEGIALSYVLTNFHVVRSAVTYAQEFSTLLGREIKVAHTAEVTVGNYQYRDVSRLLTAQSYRTRLVAYSETADLALLEVISKEPFEYVARLLPKEGVRELYMGMPVIAVGCPLGHKPTPVEGILSSLDEYIKNRHFYLTDAPQIFGNSGGSVFVQRGKDWHLLGVPSMIEVVWGAPITHLAYIIPVGTVRAFLEDECYQFLYSDEMTYQECKTLRKGKRDALQQALEERFQRERAEK